MKITFLGADRTVTGSCHMPIGIGLLFLQFLGTIFVDVQKLASGEFSKEAA